MKTKFKVSDLNEVEKKIVLSMLSNSHISAAFVCEALRYYIEKIFTMSREDLRNALGAVRLFTDEKEWGRIARQLNTDLKLGVQEYLDTPRGCVYYGFYTMAEAKAAGYGFYFEHDGINIVGNGTRAMAVREPIKR